MKTKIIFSNSNLIVRNRMRKNVIAFMASKPNEEPFSTTTKSSRFTDNDDDDDQKGFVSFVLHNYTFGTLFYT